jgi:hypothetical protein
MVVYLDKSGTTEALADLLTRVQQVPGIGGVQVLAASANGYTSEAIDPLLREVELPLFGGVFPAILYQGEMLERGALVIGIPAKLTVTTVHTLSDVTEEQLDTVISQLGEVTDQRGTVFFWADGFAQQISPLLQAFHNQYGLTYNVLGGGAGAIDFVQRPCIITNQGLLADAAVLALVALPSGVAARHGWVKIAGPYQVTNSSGNAIHTLNWRPALQVYRSVLDSVAGIELRDDDFYEAAQSFPFGIQRYGVERVVRDPIRVEGESLVCVGDIPEGSLVDILTGSDASLLVAADDALLQSENQLRAHGKVQTVFVIDCVSRMLFLQDRFHLELVALHNPGVETIGVLSLGEFACNGKDYPAFLNKTAVVGMFAVYHRAGSHEHN